VAVPVDPVAVALSVGQTLDALGVRYTIGGSLASSVAGEPRSTVDIDFVVALDSAQIPGSSRHSGPTFTPTPTRCSAQFATGPARTSFTTPPS